MTPLRVRWWEVIGGGAGVRASERRRGWQKSVTGGKDAQPSGNANLPHGVRRQLLQGKVAAVDAHGYGAARCVLRKS